jgi:hypothetical protein
MFSNGLPGILPATDILMFRSGKPEPRLTHRQVRTTVLNRIDLSRLYGSANHPVPRAVTQSDPPSSGCHLVRREHGTGAAGFSLMMEQVQGGALAEPFELGIAERMVEAKCLAAPIGMLDPAFDRLARRYLL